MGQGQFGIDPEVVNGLAAEVAAAKAQGHELCLVVGGGNIFRGIAAAAQGFDRTSADYMGMLATVMNALALQDALESLNEYARVMSAIQIHDVCEDYIRRRAVRHLEKERVVIFVAGTGNPFFTTDSAACLRGIEIEADAVLKATKVDGVYDKDPKKFADAKLLPKITYQEAVANEAIKVMDKAAVGLAMEQNMPVIVLDPLQEDNLLKAATGTQIGSYIS